MSKTLQEKNITLGLAGPSIWTAADSPVAPGADGRVVPVDDIGADINPATISDAANFAEDMMQDGRRGEGSGNDYYPDETNSTPTSHKVGDSLSPTSAGETGKVFAEPDDMSFNDVDAQYQKANSSPGVTPNFFTSADEGQKIGDLLDKTGGDDSKDAKSLVESAKSAVNTAVQTQLASENFYDPTDDYTDSNPKSIGAAQLTDELYRGTAKELGVASQAGLLPILGNLLGKAKVGAWPAKGWDSNKYHPPAAVIVVDSHKVGDAIALSDGEAQFAKNTDMSFNDDGAQYQLANSTPGITPNFFKSDEDGKKVGDLIDKTGLDPTKDARSLMASAKTAVNLAVQDQLASENPYDPSAESSPYTSVNPGSDKDVTDQLFIKDQNAPGKFEKTAAEGESAGTLDNLVTHAKTDGSTTLGLGDVRKSWTSNTYKPTTTTSVVDGHTVGDALSLAANANDGNVFASSVDHDNDTETAEIFPPSLQSSGQGLPSITSTPGSDPLIGQTLGTFFEQDQIDDVLDKTGAATDKKGSDLFSQDNVDAIASNVQEQLSDGNIYKPDDDDAAGQYTATEPMWPEGDDVASTAEDLGIPGEQSTPGAHDSSVAKITVEDLAAKGSTLTAANTTYPITAPGVPPADAAADTMIIPGEGDSFFKTPSQLTFTGGQYRDGESTPGVGNSFFTPAQVGSEESGTGLMGGGANELMAKADAAADASGQLTLDTQTQLAESNVDDPDSSHVPVASHLDFPHPKDAMGSNAAEPHYPADQTEKGIYNADVPEDAAAHFAPQQASPADGDSSKPATGYLGINQHHPSDTSIADFDTSTPAQKKIIAGEGDTFFGTDKSDAAQSYTGLGVPKTEGSGESPVTKLGTFFEQDQIDLVLNKDASLVNTEDKTLPASELFSPDTTDTHTDHTQAQLEKANVNVPGDGTEHAAAHHLKFPDPTDEMGSQAKETTYPADQTHPGGYIKPESDKSFPEHLTAQIDGSSAKFSQNTYHPGTPTIVDGELSPTPSSADDVISPGDQDVVFAVDTQMVPTPGVGPNFFSVDQIDGTPTQDPIVPKNVVLTDDNFDPDAEVDGQTYNYQSAVYGVLASENLNAPATAQIEGAKPHAALQFSFPKLTDVESISPDMSVPGHPTTMGDHKHDPTILIGAAAFRDITQEKLAKDNAYRPRGTSPPVGESLANIFSTPHPKDLDAEDPDAAEDDWFVPAQDKQRPLGGVSGKGFEDYVPGAMARKHASDDGIIDSVKVDPETAGTPRGGRGTESKTVFSSVLVSETGFDDPEDVVRVPIPGAISDYLDRGPDYKGTDENGDPVVDEDPHGVIKTVISMLETENIYHPTPGSPFFRDQKYFKRGGGEENEKNQTMFTLQRDLGVFANEIKGNNGSGVKITLSDMISFSQALALAGIGGDGPSGLLQDNAVSILDSYNPLVQLGLASVNFIDLDLKSFATDLDDGGLKTKLEAATGGTQFVTRDNVSLLERGNGQKIGSSMEFPYNSTSFGQINNFYFPFGNGVLFDSVGMLLLACMACVSILILALLVEFLVSFMDEEFPDKDTKNPETMQFGRANSTGKAGAGQATLDFILQDFLRLPRTDYALIECIAHGMTLMLGFPSGLTSTDVGFGLATGQGLIDFAINLITAPSYYVNYIRQICMSGQLVGNSFSDIGAPSAQSFEKFFVSLDKLINSKFVRFVMIAAGVGDQNLKSLFGNVSNKTERLYQLKNAAIDSVNPDAVFSDFDLTNDEHVKSGQMVARLRGNLTRWGSKKFKNTLSLSTFPASQVPDPRVTDLLTSSPYRLLKPARENVENMERLINAEYVPFYFHDLRTHEILSLPAFVTAFDESYAVNYSSFATYGRQDPVKIYNGTERTINLTFKVVSFNESDFKAMWYTINKFVSMVYPQYSKGVERSLTTGDGKEITFIQPFSQTPAASPVIRIRLGDLYRSNYSTAGLKRLFGYYSKIDPSSEEFTGGDFKIDETSEHVQQQQDTLANLVNKKITDLKALVDVGDKAKEVGKGNLFIYVEAGDTTGETSASAKSIMFVKQASPLPGSGPEPLKSADEEVIINPDGKLIIAKSVLLKGVKQVTQMQQRPGGGPVPAGQAFIEGTFEFYLIEKLEGKDPDATPLKIGGETQFRIAAAPAIFSNKDTHAKVMKSPLYKEAEDDATVKAFDIDDTVQAAADSFFDSQNNAVRRSFESTMGTGLAGVITSLSMGYAEATWETSAHLGRAPKTVEISMTFAPMHDLPMGLDYTGQIRALSHPAAIDHNNSDKPGAFGSVYDNMGNTISKDYTKTIAVLDKFNRGVDDDNAEAHKNRFPTTSP